MRKGVPENHTDIHDAASELGWHVDVVRRKTPKHLRKYYRGWRSRSLQSRRLAIPNDHLQRLKAEKTELLERPNAERKVLGQLPDSASVSIREAAKLLHRLAGYAQATMERMVFEKIREKGISAEKGLNPRTNRKATLVIIADVKRLFGMTPDEPMQSGYDTTMQGMPATDRPKSKAAEKGDSWFDHEPPDDSRFKFGPVEGTIRELTDWIGQSRNTMKARNGSGWWIMQINYRKYAAWFGSQKRFAEVNQQRLRGIETS